MRVKDLQRVSLLCVHALRFVPSAAVVTSGLMCTVTVDYKEAAGILQMSSSFMYCSYVCSYIVFNCAIMHNIIRT